jgi:hypothetical protein
MRTSFACGGATTTSQICSGFLAWNAMAALHVMGLPTV